MGEERMPVEDGGLVMIGEELMGTGLPTFIDVDDLACIPRFNISADAEATFECEIATPNLLRMLCGITDDAFVSATFTCETPQTVQVRKHRKKRINKKWAKRYGYKYVVKPLGMMDVSWTRPGEAIDILGRVVR